MKIFLTWLNLLYQEVPHFITIVCFYLIFAILEWKIPAQAKQSISGRIRNITYTVIYFLAGFALLSMITFNLPWPEPLNIPESFLTSFLYCLLYIFIMDFFFYWYHRAQHKFALLWPIHELHHSDSELNSTSSIRTYWLELPIQVILISLPTIYILNPSSASMKLLPVILTAWLFFTHANLRLSLGVLTSIFCGPQLHRIHHSKKKKHHNKNFAQFFPIYDLIFGTYYKPSKNEYPETGTFMLQCNASISYVVKRPFKIWWKKLREFILS